MKGRVIELEFLGAAQTVTGSMHLVRGPDSTVLLECGLYQGRRRESLERNANIPLDPSVIDAVVVSHAHIDHCGALPRLYKLGYRGPIYATNATRDLCAVMLEDAAAIQAADARYMNEHREEAGLEGPPLEPLYDTEDVAGVISLMRGVPYHARTRVAKGADVTFLEAGHILGSAVVCLDVDDVGQEKRIAFSGDLGRYHKPILRDPEVPSNASFLICESTYGDRLHDSMERMEDDFADVVNRTIARNGKIVIPSFALERAQEVIYALKRLKAAGRIPVSLPVYVDSPLAVRVTEVFRMHPDCFDKETRRVLESDDSPFDFPGLEYVRTVERSKELDAIDGSAVIIAASGMCEFGRVLHHLRATVEDMNSTVVIVGFQAQHTLGRRLVEGRTRVKILGVERERRCEVKVLNGFSAHGDQNDLLAFIEGVRERGPLREVALVHGEIGAQNALREKLTDRGFPTVRIPAQGERAAV
jgi:metallo-beta-lactamase family protein